jgi:sodium-dependent phosphate transporter
MSCASLKGVKHLYVWIVIMGGLNSFADACGIGMNDLANSFGTIYGSKVLNKWQIVVIACCCEFSGALLLGKQVVSTISGSISNSKYFANDPYVLMYGFLCALAASTTWLYTATYMKLPVSTTHAIVGGILGFSIVYGGSNGVNWITQGLPDFPYISGFVPIAISWASSPILAGFLSSIVYTFVKLTILRRQNAGNRAAWFFPFILGITFFVESFLIITKGASSQLDWTKDLSKVAWISVIVGVCGGLIAALFVPALKSGLLKHEENVANGNGYKMHDLPNEIKLNFSEQNCFAYAYQEFFRDPYTIKPLAKKYKATQFADEEF